MFLLIFPETGKIEVRLHYKYRREKEEGVFMTTASVKLKKGEGRSLKAGGAWIYDNEIAEIRGDYENGDMVFVEDFDGYPMGQGFINTRSKITVRMMTRKPDTEVNEDFIEMRVRNAWEYRKSVTDTSSCRLIFGEADFLPGIVVDKFSDVLVVESLALGIDRWKPVILEKLKKVLAEDGIAIRGIYERSDAKVRQQEGMERYKGFVGEPFDTKVEIVENGVRYLVDVQDGQKTGFFLDQKQARENAELNGLSERVSFVCADVFDLLPELEQKGEKYDVVILDPPAFTKSRSSVKNAVKGYREINIRGLKLVKDGGYLATCSCSHFMDPELFTKTIREAAAGAHKRLRQVEYRTQAADHPILWTGGEQASYYLKFYIFQVCDEK